MKRKKVCMLGAFAVGKTSLVSRYVHSMFSERYQTTVGVKVDKKVVESGDEPVTLVLWDLFGEDDYQEVKTTFLRGSAGFLLVVDGTRPRTLETALGLRERALETVGDVPMLLLLNKADLAEEWELDPDALTERAGGLPVLRTSAKTGAGVEEAFHSLVQAMLVAR